MEAAELWKGCTIPRREAVGKESNGKAAPYPSSRHQGGSHGGGEAL